MSISPAWHQVFSILQFDEADGLCQNHQQYRRGAKYLRMAAIIYIFDRRDKWKDIPFSDVTTGDDFYSI